MGKRGKRIKKKNRKRKESREINEQKTKKVSDQNGISGVHSKYVVLESEKNNYPQEKKDELIQAMKQKWEGMEEWQQDQMKNNN